MLDRQLPYRVRYVDASSDLLRRSCNAPGPDGSPTRSRDHARRPGRARRAPAGRPRQVRPPGMQSREVGLGRRQVRPQSPQVRLTPTLCTPAQRTTGNVVVLAAVGLVQPGQVVSVINGPSRLRQHAGWPGGRQRAAGGTAHRPRARASPGAGPDITMTMPRTGTAKKATIAVERSILRSTSPRAPFAFEQKAVPCFTQKPQGRPRLLSADSGVPRGRAVGRLLTWQHLLLPRLRRGRRVEHEVCPVCRGSLWIRA